MTQLLFFVKLKTGERSLEKGGWGRIIENQTLHLISRLQDYTKKVWDPLVEYFTLVLDI